MVIQKGLSLVSPPFQVLISPYRESRRAYELYSSHSRIVTIYMSIFVEYFLSWNRLYRMGAWQIVIHFTDIFSTRNSFYVMEIRMMHSGFEIYRSKMLNELIDVNIYLLFFSLRKKFEKRSLLFPRYLL